MSRLSCLIAVLLCCCLSACATVKMPVCSGSGNALPFDEAVTDLAKGLDAQIMGSRTPIEMASNPVRTVVFDPFIDLKNAQELKINTQIYEIMSRSFRGNITLVPLTVENLQKADMVLTGVIILDDNPSDTKGKAYHLFASVLTIRSGLARARVCTWSQRVDLAPMAVYEDAPTYIKDIYLRNQEAAAKAENDSYAHTAYIQHLGTRAMLHHAYQTFERGDYKSTLVELDEIAKRPDGLNMATYSAMYMSYIALDDLDGARHPLARLFKLSVDSEKLIDVKLLFEVSSDALLQKSQRQAKEYALWLQEISKIVKEYGICLIIVGHCSHTGNALYNEGLSLKRAKVVQRIMTTQFKELEKKTRVLGRGFNENIVGTGTDDVQDMIDRRVEFRIIDCGRMESVAGTLSGPAENRRSRK